MGTAKGESMFPCPDCGGRTGVYDCGGGTRYRKCKVCERTCVTKEIEAKELAALETVRDLLISGLGEALKAAEKAKPNPPEES